MQIKQLEERLGVALFQRTTRKVELTSAGEQLMISTRKAMAELDGALLGIQQQANAEHGHPFHKPIDPRTPRLKELASENGFDGPYLRLMDAIAEEAGRASSKVLPMNATGAIGALCCEMGFDWKICRGLGVMARAVGLVGHILEESRKPMAAEIWHRIEDVATAHLRPGASE